MRDKFLIGFLCGCVTLLAVGCGGGRVGGESSVVMAEMEVLATEGQIDDGPADEGEGYYGKVIAAVRDCIVNKALEIPEGYDFSTAFLTAGEYGTFGYLIEDLDGDGVDELILGMNGANSDGPWECVIFDIYTVSDGELVHVLDGWERNRYFFCDNGMIANEGSSGAGNSNYSYFNFDDGEICLVESVIYDGGRDSENPWFYSTEEVYDGGNAEAISEERAMEIMGKYRYVNQEFDLFDQTEG